VHEYSIVAALVDQVEREAHARGACAVHRVHVDIGELAGVECDLLSTAYETFRGGTVCANAPLQIHHVAARWRCRGCGRPVPSGSILRCEHCGQPARLDQGDEITLSRIEMEVSDV
jgi:hydrogenase nickel incorporation protein HypA/HybF